MSLKKKEKPKYRIATYTVYPDQEKWFDLYPKKTWSKHIRRLMLNDFKKHEKHI